MAIFGGFSRLRLVNGRKSLIALAAIFHEMLVVLSGLSIHRDAGK
jgi:hypothetical protein